MQFSLSSPFLYLLHIEVMHFLTHLCCNIFVTLRIMKYLLNELNKLMQWSNPPCQDDLIKRRIQLVKEETNTMYNVNVLFLERFQPVHTRESETSYLFSNGFWNFPSTGYVSVPTSPKHPTYSLIRDGESICFQHIMDKNGTSHSSIHEPSYLYTCINVGTPKYQ